ncbi:TPM domain-containing protein [Paenibacillus sp. J5C_2022]|nr:TPM domain-containing protein [Paenibacillus sp. J5C2022]MCU6708711.1 TPM domain-containing protein [Paenibacillus sp. J5C2022]
MLTMLLIAVFVALAVPMPNADVHASEETKQLIYDEAGLLEQDELALLEGMAQRYGAKRETDIIIYTSNNTSGADVMKMTQDFYDKHGFGYDKPYGNAVILTLDMNNRELYLAGFYKAEEYLDDSRLDRIRDKITSDLSSGFYYGAFSDYIKTAYRYMGYAPGVNPDNILFKVWFQYGVAALLALFFVWRLAANSGGSVTVHRGTYENAGTSGVIGHSDQYIRTTVTKRPIPRSTDNSSGGGGGGGTTSGGHSHSGSRGSF